jgi:exosortase
MKYPSRKTFLFLFLTTAAVGMAFAPLWDLLKNTKQAEQYSHIPLIPVISAYFIYRRRREWLERPASFCIAGLPIFVLSMGLFFWSLSKQVALKDFASLTTLSAVLFWLGALVWLYGWEAVRELRFPLAFLIFAIPIPAILMNRIISVLTAASIGVTSFLFKMIHIPFVQEGSMFYLPGFSLEVAKECSGIRSGLALLITCILAGHLFLGRLWKKAFFILAVFPVAVFKNGLRIVSLYLLSYFIDMRFIEGNFHHKFSGSVFFLFGLIVLGIILWFLRGSEVN